MIEFDIRSSLAAQPVERLQDMRDAADQVLECHRILSVTDDNIVGELIKNEEIFYEWNHYPDGDVYDAVSHSQYYYHAHPADERANEHGHFHVFMRPKGMPAGIKPARIPEYEAPDDPDDNLSHLTAISMDSAGLPIRLFATNRWVTGEVWYDGDDVCRMLDHFVIDHAQPSWPVNLWISGMIRLFDPQIRVLIAARDAAIHERRKSHPGMNIFEDRDFEVVAECDINIETQLEAVEAELNRRGVG